MSKAALERRLSAVVGFEDPQVHLEQYPTPADLAAHLVHLADLQGDLAGRTVLDLGTGTGMLALGAACREPNLVVGLDRDPTALRQARENERRVAAEGSRSHASGAGAADAPAPLAPLEWVLGDATRAPVCRPADSDEKLTVLMNPPFGAQHGREHADRAFLETVAELGDVSYSIHNAGSQAFVESFASDAGGEVTHGFRADLALDRQFDHQTSEREVVEAEVFRVRWR